MPQSFRWNGTDYYTVFGLPISVTNSMPENDDRIDCDLLENKLVSATEIGESLDSLPRQPWVKGGVSTTVSSPEASHTGAGKRCHLGFKRVAGIAVAVTAILHFLG
jgi:hypothetical protein